MILPWPSKNSQASAPPAAWDPPVRVYSHEPSIPNGVLCWQGRTSFIHSLCATATFIHSPSLIQSSTMPPSCWTLLGRQGHRLPALSPLGEHSREPGDKGGRIQGKVFNLDLTVHLLYQQLQHGTSGKARLLSMSTQDRLQPDPNSAHSSSESIHPCSLPPFFFFLLF